MEQLMLKLTNIHQSFGAKEVLTIGELTAYQNDRIGIIGRNGAGKSTLLNIIQGSLQPESGQVQRETNFNYFAQSEKAKEQTDTDKLDWELMGRFSIPKTPLETLSGGEENKYRLAQVLSTYQMGLLLDEPTTHLDQRSVQQLVEELTYYYGTLIFVSHDRFFLNQLATKIWEVSNGTVTEYVGNFDQYQQQKENATLEAKRAHTKYLAEKKQLETAITRKKQQATKSQHVSQKQKQKKIKPDRLSSSKQKDTVQKNLQKTAKALESRLQQLNEPESIEKQQSITFPPAKMLAIHNPYPIRGENFSLKKGKQLLTSCDFQFELGKKIALVGDNGVGKSSFLQSILAQAPGIILSPNVRFSTYQQMAYKMSGTESILSYLMKQTDYNEAFVRSLLHNLGFSQIEVSKPLDGLSGGEATRIQIALLFLKPANVLILDEPTNFIDLQTIESLESLLLAYPGTVLFTSHDYYFVQKVADKIYQFQAQNLKEILSTDLM